MTSGADRRATERCATEARRLSAAVDASGPFGDGALAHFAAQLESQAEVTSRGPAGDAGAVLGVRVLE